MKTGPRFKVSSERLEEQGIEPATPRLLETIGQGCLLYTVETELKLTQSALDVHMGCMPFLKD